MKPFGKYISKFLAKFIGMILILFFINIAAFIWTFYHVVSKDYGDLSPQNMLEKMETSASVDGISAGSVKQLKNDHIWAVYTDLNGKVMWEVNAPQEVPEQFTIQDIAVIAKGYLADFPVFIRNTNDGMLILGYPKDSYTKIMSNYFSIHSIQRFPFFIITILVTDFVILFLAYFFSKRKILKNIEPIIDAIGKLENGEPISVSVRGELSAVANSVNKASQILSKQNQARANWISGVSHDIRTPLSMIMGYAEQIACAKNVDSPIRRKAEIIGQQSVKMKELIQDLNLVSRLEYEMQPLNKTPLRLASLIRSYAAELLNTGLPDRYSIDIEIALTAETIIFDCDERLILRAINNLVQNSIRHNPKGCDVIISLDHTAETIDVTVSDNGVGLTHEKLKELNEKPHYMESDDNRLDLRHGLGLNIVRQIVKAHNGTMRFIMNGQTGFSVELIFPQNIEKL